MKMFKAAGVLLMAIHAMPAGADKMSLSEFDAYYDVYRSGIKVAKMQRSFSRQNDGTLLYRSETKVTGVVSLFRKDKIVETSTWRYDEGRIIPGFYEYLHSGVKDERNVTVEFDWNESQIVNSVNGSSWKMPISEGILDKLLYQLCIMLDLREGKSDLTYTIADGGREKTYTFEIMGEEIIETPLGSLRTIKIKRYREDSDRESIVWSAPVMGYFPVRFENVDDGEKTVVLINSLSGMEFEKTQQTGQIQAENIN